MIPRANICVPGLSRLEEIEPGFPHDGCVQRHRILAEQRRRRNRTCRQGKRRLFSDAGHHSHAGPRFPRWGSLPAAPFTVILGYSTWQKRYGGRPDVVGQSVTLSGVPHTIIGVLPQSFQFAPRGNAEFWTTLHATDSCSVRRSCHYLDGIGRLKDGVSVEMARANMKSIASQLELQYPTDNRGQGAFVAPLSEVIVLDIRPVLLALLGGAGLLLVIACVNVTSLLLVRSESRKREIAVRGALGASRLRLVRQFTADGLVLVTAGVLIGLIGAQAAIRILTSLLSKDMLSYMPYLDGLGLSSHTLGFAALLALTALIVFSITPIARLPLREIRSGLAEGGRGYAGTLWRRFGSNLVVVELAVRLCCSFPPAFWGKAFITCCMSKSDFRPTI